MNETIEGSVKGGDKSGKSVKLPETFSDIMDFSISAGTESQQWQMYLEGIAPGKFSLLEISKIQGGGVRLRCGVRE